MYGQDIRMDFSKEKCAIQLMRSGKRHVMERIELPNQKRMLEEKETYKYFGILEVDTIKQVETKEKIKKA